MAGAVERRHGLRRGATSDKPPKTMSITERLYYLRERGYGIKTVGCIELSRLIRLAEKGETTYAAFNRGCRDIVATVESMIRTKQEEKMEDAYEG